MATVTRRPKLDRLPVLAKPIPPAPKPKPPDEQPKARRKLGSYGNASIDQHDAVFIKASNAVFKKRGVRVDPHFLKAMMDVETGENGDYPPDRCRPFDGTDNVPACGPFQIKWPYHFQRCAECDRATLDGQGEMAAHIIGMTMLERGRDEFDALVTTYFPGGDINGTSQKMYVDRVRKLVKIMEADLQGQTPPDDETPAPGKKASQQDVLNLISSNAPGVYISFGYNQRNAGNRIYTYGIGHMQGGDNRFRGEMHPGVDIWMPDETPVNAVFGGEVVCVGSAGSVVWDQGCGYFSDDNGGIGNITVLCDAVIEYRGKQRQLKITYGHMSSATVRVGERVQPGQSIGRSGIGGTWPHVHLDVTVKEDFAGELNHPEYWFNPGAYHLLDPIPAILAAMGSDELPVIYDPTRVDVPQPDAWESGAKVVVTKGGVPLLQRANRNAVQVDSPFEKGDEFEAVMLVWSEDERGWYWVTPRKTRIPIDGTASKDAPKVPAA